MDSIWPQLLQIFERKRNEDEPTTNKKQVIFRKVNVIGNLNEF